MSELVPANELMAKKVGSVNPSNHQEEVFDLFSIPAYDSGKPETIEGSEIGSSKKNVEPNDVLISRIVPHIRRCWIVPEGSGRRQIASGEWITFRSKRFFPNYLRHYLMSDGFHKQFMQTVSGVGGSLLRARPAEVEKIEIPLPRMKDQKRIAAILDKADDIRRKRQQAIQLVDEFLRSIFLDMFGDPILNSQKLPTVRIDQLSKVIRGSSPRPKGDSRYYDGPVPRLMVEDLTRDGWFVTPSIDSLTEEGAKLSRPVPKGTLVMVVSGKVGVMARLEVDACIHDGFVALLNIDEETVLPNYLMFALTYLQQTHAKREAGAIFKNLTTSQIKEMDIPIPSIEQQKKFDEIFFAQRTLLRKLKSIDDEFPLMGSLQQIAFRGAANEL